MESEVSLEILLVVPSAGVGFCLQKGKAELIDYQVSEGNDIKFNLSVRVKRGKNEVPNFLSQFTQRTPKQRFIYVYVGEYAGQKDTEWASRVKIHLSSITWQQVEQVLNVSNGKLVARYR